MENSTENGKILWEAFKAAIRFEEAARRLGNLYGKTELMIKEERVQEALDNLCNEMALVLNRFEDICDAGILSYEAIDTVRVELKDSKKENSNG